MNMLSRVSHAGLEPGEFGRWLGPAMIRKDILVVFSVEDSDSLRAPSDLREIRSCMERERERKMSMS